MIGPTLLGAYLGQADANNRRRWGWLDYLFCCGSTAAVCFDSSPYRGQEHAPPAVTSEFGSLTFFKLDFFLFETHAREDA